MVACLSFSTTRCTALSGLEEVDTLLKSAMEEDNEPKDIKKRLNELKDKLDRKASGASASSEVNIGETLFQRAKDFGTGGGGSTKRASSTPVTSFRAGKERSGRVADLEEVEADSVSSEREETDMRSRTVFRLASSQETGDIGSKARLKPGALLTEALKSIGRFLSASGGAKAGDEEGRVLTYVLTVFVQRYGSDHIGLRNMRELRTLAEAIDSLVAGNLPREGDLLIQRFKAIEVAVADGSWTQARHLELIPSQDVTLVSTAERSMASRLELQKIRLNTRKGE